MSGWLVQAVWILLIGTAGGMLAELLKVPSGGLIGSMLAVLLVRMLGAPLEAPPDPISSHLQFWLMIPVGALIGAALDRGFFAKLTTLALPTALFVAVTIATSLLAALLLHRTAAIDLTTAYLGTSPGGLNTVVLIALALQADVGIVAVLQTSRLLAVLLSVPWVARWLQQG